MQALSLEHLVSCSELENKILKEAYFFFLKIYSV